jgi:hypothetical protein
MVALEFANKPNVSWKSHKGRSVENRESRMTVASEEEAGAVEMKEREKEAGGNGKEVNAEAPARTYEGRFVLMTNNADDVVQRGRHRWLPR